jgi:hypothetical protein
VLRGELAEAGGIEIQPLDRDSHLVVRNFGRIVQLEGGLRQHPLGLPDAVQSDG